MSRCTSVNVLYGQAHTCRKDHIDPAFHRCRCNRTWGPAVPPIEWERTYHDPYSDRPSYIDQERA